MGCISGDSYPGSSGDGLINTLRNRNDELTRLLCSLCKKVEQVAPQLIAVDEELTSWWVSHKAFDKKRLKKNKK